MLGVSQITQRRLRARRIFTLLAVLAQRRGASIFLPRSSTRRATASLEARTVPRCDAPVGRTVGFHPHPPQRRAHCTRRSDRREHHRRDGDHVGHFPKLGSDPLLALIIDFSAISPSRGQYWAWGHFQSILIEQQHCHPICRHGGGGQQSNRPDNTQYHHSLTLALRLQPLFAQRRPGRSCRLRRFPDRPRLSQRFSPAA